MTIPTEKRETTDRRIKTILEEIHPEFILSGARTITREDVGRFVESSEAILAHFTKGGPLRRFAREVKPMVGLVRDYWTNDYTRAPLWTVSVITFSLLYVMKPIDIIPDALPVIGQLDDAIVVGHGLELVRSELEVYKEWSADTD